MTGVQVLVLATDRSATKRSGDPIQVRSYERLAIHPWGKLERPPFFVVVDLPDAEVVDVEHLVASELEDFVREDGQTKQRVVNHRQFSVDAGLVSRGVLIPDGVIPSDKEEFVAATTRRPAAAIRREL